MPQQQETQSDRRDDLADAWARVAIDVAQRIAERDRDDEQRKRETEPVRRAA